MPTLFFKKKLFRKIIIFIVAGLVLLNGSITSCSPNLFASDTLRPTAERHSKSSPDIQGALERAQAIGFIYNDDSAGRVKQITALLTEIDQELAQPGSGINLPRIAIISDYHGDVERFAALLSDILNQLAGFKGQINPAVSIEEQLNAQGLSLKDINGAIYLTGDLLDRGKEGIACFNLAKELIEIAPDRVFYVSGNHDFWAFGNLLAIHLPWYDGFNFYGDEEAEKLVREKRNPEEFKSSTAQQENILWWAARLAEYNIEQDQWEKELISGTGELSQEDAFSKRPAVSVLNKGGINQAQFNEGGIFFFDHDGTLGAEFAHESAVSRIVEVLIEHGVPADEAKRMAPDYYYPTKGLASEKFSQTLTEALRKDGFEPGDTFSVKNNRLADDRVIQDLKQQAKRKGSHILRVPGALQFLQFLESQGIDRYVMTGGTASRRLAIAKRAGITSYITSRPGIPIIMGGTSSGEWAKKSDNIKRLLERREYQLLDPKRQVVMIGDGVSDIRHGKEAGVLTIGIARTETEWKALAEAGADIVIKDDFRAWPELARTLGLKTSLLFKFDIKELRKEFIGHYEKYSKNWDEGQLDAWENFVGSFVRMKVSGPSVGLNGIGKTSWLWWRNVEAQLQDGLSARKASGAEGPELQAWEEAVSIAGDIAKMLTRRSDTAVSEGKWWYRVFESINTQAYGSVEWWCKDWSSHKGWGEAVIAEVNEMIERGIIEEENLTQANYLQSPTLQALGRFYQENFNLHLRDPYGNFASHGWFPVEESGEIVIDYNREASYTGEEVFEALRIISDDVKDISKAIPEILSALSLVNSWYADATTRIKPNHIKRYVEETGVDTINSKLGVRNWFTGHNPLNSLDVPFMSERDGYAHFETDKGMAAKFGHQGAYVLIGPGGITLRGFEDKDSQDVVESPATPIIDKKTGDVAKIIENPSLPAKEFLERTKAALEEELTALNPQTANDGGQTFAELYGVKFAPAAEVFTSDIDIKPELVNKIQNAHTGDQALPIVIHHEVLQSLPAIMLLHNFASSFGLGQIKFVIDTAGADTINILDKEIQLTNITMDGRDSLADNIFAEIYAIWKADGVPALNRDIITAVVTGKEVIDVVNQVKEKFGTGIAQVIGDASYSERFKDVIEGRIILGKAGINQIESWAKALKLAVNLIPVDGDLTAEDVKQLDAAFSKDNDGNYHVAATSLAAGSQVAKILSNYATTIEAAIKI